MPARSSIAVVCVGLSLWLSSGQARAGDPAVVLRPILTERFEAIRSVHDLDLSVRVLLNTDGGERPNERLADPGEPFCAGCTPGPRDAMRRLVQAGRAGDLRFVEWEHGGISRGFILALCRVENGKARLLAQADGPLHAPDLASLQAVVRDGKMTVFPVRP